MYFLRARSSVIVEHVLILGILASRNDNHVITSRNLGSCCMLTKCLVRAQLQTIAKIFWEQTNYDEKLYHSIEHPPETWLEQEKKNLSFSYTWPM